MSKRICFYNNKLFLASDCYVLVFCYKNFPKTKDEKFSECFKIKLPIACTSTLDITLDVIDSYITGFKSLLIFLSYTSGERSIFLYCDALSKKLHEIILPNLFEAGDDLFVSDGPAFLFISKNAFHIYPLPYYKNKYCDSVIPLPDCKEFKVMQFKSIGPLFESSYQLCLYLLIISCNFSSQRSLKILSFISVMRNTETNFKQLDINIKDFFPPCYETILWSIEITNAIPHLKTDLPNAGLIEWKETASVICTENECLIFSNANLQYCCKISVPLLNMMYMKTNFMNTFSGNLNFVLTIEHKCVYFIEVKQNAHPEVVKQWIDIEATIIGDILMKGSKQVLLLKEGDLNTWQNNIMLYDMSSFMLIDVFCHSSVPDNCLQTTISGLERKVQVGKSVIRDMEFEISQKSAATADALVKLNEFKASIENLKSSQNFQQTLVDLILSKDENKIESVAVESESSVKLLKTEHRYLDNRLIMSLCFINEEERCICYPSIKVLKRNNQLTCIQKLFVCKSDDSVFTNESGREINEKTKFYIILNLKIFEFQIDEDICLILTWYNGSTNEFDNEVFMKEDKKILTQKQLCIQRKITLSDILKQQTQKGISSISDLLFTRALLQRTNLCISSLHSDISIVETILFKNDSSSNCQYLLDNSSTRYVLFNKDNSPLFGVHFSIINSTYNFVEIAAFSRNGSEICLLVHYLYQYLPKDVMIFPCLTFREEYTEAKKNLAVCMKSEVDLLLSSFNTHNISEEMRKNYVKLMSSQTAGTLIIPKINYHRIRTVLVKKECITDTLFKNINQDTLFLKAIK